MGRHGAAGVRGTVGTGPARARAGFQELRQAPDAAWQLEARGCGAATPRKRARAARPPPPSPARGASHIPPQPPETAVVLAARPPPVPPQPRPRRGPWLPSSAGGGQKRPGFSATEPNAPSTAIHSRLVSQPRGPRRTGPARTVFFPVAVQPGRTRQGQRPCCPSFSHCHPEVLAGNLRPPKASRAAGPCGAHVWGMLRRVCRARGNPSRLATGMLTGEHHVKRERGCGSARLSPEREQSPPSDTSGWRGADRPGAVGLPAGRVPAPADLEPTPRPVLPVGCVAQSRGQQARCPLVLPRFPCGLRGPLSGRQHGVESEDSPSRWAFGEPVTLLLEPGAVSSV